MRPLNRLQRAALGTGVTLSIESPAQAYLDPTTGSMILQVDLGGFVGLADAGKLYWARLKAVFGHSSDDALVNEESSDVNAD